MLNWIKRAKQATKGKLIDFYFKLVNEQPHNFYKLIYLFLNTTPIFMQILSKYFFSNQLLLIG